MSHQQLCARAENAGILAIDVYTPALKVQQCSLEQAHDVPGKYTVGLGQEALAVCTDREDVVSMALTVVRSLLDKYDIQLTDVGRLEVGTETGLDRSKSIKSHLMQLFNRHGVYDLEGTDCVHACYGGTAALFNTAAWVESSAWNGRLGLVVSADVALYPLSLSSCATGGCGAVAMLVGPDAPLALDPWWRATYSTHCFEFYKPVGRKDPYPVVDGPATVEQFLAAVDACAAALHRKLAPPAGLLQEVQHYVSHAPFNKLVCKGLSRILLQDMLRCGEEAAGGRLPDEGRGLDPDHLPASSRQDKQLERALLEAAHNIYQEKASTAAAVQKLTGNSYTACLYIGLASLVEACPADLPGSRILMFSFGSGVVATLFALKARDTGSSKFSLANVAAKLGLRNTVWERDEVTWKQLQENVEGLEAAYSQAPYSPQGSLLELRAGTYYLQDVDAEHRRHYACK